MSSAQADDDGSVNQMSLLDEIVEHEATKPEWDGTLPVPYGVIPY